MKYKIDRDRDIAHNTDKKRKKQIAQLLQRDRDAGWLVMAKSEKLELEDNIYGHYRSIFNHSDVISQQNNQNR